MRIGELHARFRHDLLVDPFHEARPVAALREDGAEVQEGEVDRRRPEGPSDLGLLGHVIREVRELVLGAEMRAVLPHHRADGLLRDFQDQPFRELHVALVGHVDDDLIPDERRVLRVVEDVRLDHEAVGDRDVPARETVPVEDAPNSRSVVFIGVISTMYPRVLFSSTRSPSLYSPMTVTTIQPTMFRSGSCMTKTKAPRKTPVPMAPNCDAPLPRVTKRTRARAVA